MDYDALVADKSTQGSIKSWVNYNEVPSVDVLIDAQMYIYERLRSREMRALQANNTIAEGTDFIVLPTGFLDPVELTIRYPKSRLELVNERELQDVWRNWDDTNALTEGMPQHYAIIGSNAYFDVLPDQTYRYDLLYFKQPDLLTPGSPTNFLTQRYPHVLRQTCIGYAALFAKDYEDAGTCLKMADALIDNVREMDDLSRRGQGSAGLYG